MVISLEHKMESMCSITLIQSSFLSFLKGFLLLQLSIGRFIAKNKSPQTAKWPTEPLDSLGRLTTLLHSIKLRHWLISGDG